MAYDKLPTEDFKVEEDGTVLTANIWFGTELRCRNGMETFMWQKRGTGSTPQVKTNGWSGWEIGSTYAHDILAAKQPVSGAWVRVKLTPAQIKTRDAVRAFFGR